MKDSVFIVRGDLHQGKKMRFAVSIKGPWKVVAEFYS